jgi:hemoglobin
MPSLPIVSPPATPPDAPVPRVSPPPSAGGDAAPARAELRDEDLHDLLVDFYDRVAAEPMLAPYFAVVDMRAHMPRIVGFWSTLLFHTGRYSGNAFAPHQQMPGLTGAHFARWIATLERTVDARFAGPQAERMKELAHRVAYSMQLRLGIPPFEGYRDDAL